MKKTTEQKKIERLNKTLCTPIRLPRLVTIGTLFGIKFKTWK